MSTYSIARNKKHFFEPASFQPNLAILGKLILMFRFIKQTKKQNIDTNAAGDPFNI